MNKKLLKYEIIGFIIVSIIGTILHFMYDWTNKNDIVGLFVPVNESPWEHLKLLFFPYSIYSIFESIKLTKDKFYIFTPKLISLLSGMFMTLSIFYVCTGATGKNISVVNVISFFVGVATSFLVSYHLINKSFGGSLSNTISIICFILMALIFMFATKFPIEIPLFQDPQTKLYGIKNGS